MNEVQLQLSAEEWDFLVGYLRSALKGYQVEEHRTRTPTYREHVTHEKDMLAAILDKLERASGIASFGASER
jgi:hypothetical protein